MCTCAVALAKKTGFPKAASAALRLTTGSVNRTVAKRGEIAFIRGGLRSQKASTASSNPRVASSPLSAIHGSVCQMDRATAAVSGTYVTLAALLSFATASRQACHPPNSVISSACDRPAPSQIKPFTRRPSSKAMDPMPNGGGIWAVGFCQSPSVVSPTKSRKRYRRDMGPGEHFGML